MSSDEGADEDAIPRFMDWLKDKPEDVWFDCADRFARHDEGPWILLAMVDHPRCTKQVAASIFWRMGAYDAAGGLLKGGKLNPNSEGDMIIDRVLRKWRSGFYQVGEIEFVAPGTLYRRDILKEGSADPLNIPADLLGNFEGRKAVVDAKNPPFGNPRFWSSYASRGLDYASRSSASTDDQPKADSLNASAQPARALGIALLVFAFLLWVLLRHFMQCPELSICRFVLLKW